jgi:uncharacterized membrane protein YeaQ/YmgE (transglycosylase-associated protein family)
VLGAIAGFLANMVMGGREGVIGTIILGIIGAMVGGYLAQAVLHKGDVTGVNIESIVIAVFDEDSNIRGPLMSQIARAS